MRLSTILLTLAIYIGPVTGDGCYCPPFFYGPVCTGLTAIWGWDETTDVTYSVSIGGNMDTMVCAEGYSPDTGEYTIIGCGHGSFSRTIHWGNNIAYPKIKCKGIPTGVFIEW